MRRAWLVVALLPAVAATSPTVCWAVGDLSDPADAPEGADMRELAWGGPARVMGSRMFITTAGPADRDLRWEVVDVLQDDGAQWARCHVLAGGVRGSGEVPLRDVVDAPCEVPLDEADRWTPGAHQVYMPGVVLDGFDADCTHVEARAWDGQTLIDRAGALPSTATTCEAPETMCDPPRAKEAGLAWFVPGAAVLGAALRRRRR